MGIEKTGLLACEYIYWISISADIENTNKVTPVCLDFQEAQPKNMILLHKIAGRFWESVGAEIFSITDIFVL